MKIYTKKGDTGTTSLIGGERVMKCDSRVEAYGTIDELNSFVGLLRQKTCSDFLAAIQKDLFFVGGMLATSDCKPSEENLSSLVSRLLSLEKEIDRISESLPPLKDFILPCGCEASCLAHVCRTVCRRAERRIIALDATHPAVAYINRLSDYFFVLARECNQ